MRGRRSIRDERGSAVVEFTLVSALLTVLVVAVLQLGLSLHVRNTVLDAASEGARAAALADASPAAGVARTQALITSAVGDDYARSVDATTTTWNGAPAIEVRVDAVLPIFGLLGPPRALSVRGHAAIEELD